MAGEMFFSLASVGALCSTGFTGLGYGIGFRA